MDNDKEINMKVEMLIEWNKMSKTTHEAIRLLCKNLADLKKENEDLKKVI